MTKLFFYMIILHFSIKIKNFKKNSILFYYFQFDCFYNFYLINLTNDIECSFLVCKIKFELKKNFNLWLNKDIYF